MEPVNDGAHRKHQILPVVLWRNGAIHRSHVLTLESLDHTAILHTNNIEVDAKFLTMRLHIVAHDLIYGLISPDLESVVYKKDIF